MKISALTLLVSAATLAIGCDSPATTLDEAPDAGPPGFTEYGVHPCDPVGDVQFVCDMISPEDIAVIPDSDWVIVSGAQQGGLIYAVHTADKTKAELFPAAGAAEQLDARTYPTCPGPLQEGEFRAHGLYLRARQSGAHLLYVVHHGTRESIEVFEVDGTASPPGLTWVGCAPALSMLSLNSVVALPEGGFATTSAPTDNVWEWHTSSGWRPVPGSDGTAPNGLEISRDGRWLYIAGWAEEKVTRISRGRTPIERDEIQLGFRPDNLRMSSDGSVIFAAGHTDKDGNSITNPREPVTETSNVAAIDPETFEFRRILEQPALDGFVASTTAVQVGDELWLGSYRGDRLAYRPMPE
jgi:hypothetical protein